MSGVLTTVFGLWVVLERWLRAKGGMMVRRGVGVIFPLARCHMVEKY